MDGFTETRRNDLKWRKVKNVDTFTHAEGIHYKSGSFHTKKKLICFFLTNVIIFFSMSAVSTMKYLQLYKILLEKLHNCFHEIHPQCPLEQLFSNMPTILEGRCSSFLQCVLHFFLLASEPMNNVCRSGFSLVFFPIFVC